MMMYEESKDIIQNKTYLYNNLQLENVVHYFIDCFRRQIWKFRMCMKQNRKSILLLKNVVS